MVSIPYDGSVSSFNVNVLERVCALLQEVGNLMGSSPPKVGSLVEEKVGGTLLSCSVLVSTEERYRVPVLFVTICIDLSSLGKQHPRTYTGMMPRGLPGMFSQSNRWRAYTYPSVHTSA